MTLYIKASFLNLILFLVPTIVYPFSNNSLKVYIDSLQQAVVHSEGKEKLDALHSLVDAIDIPGSFPYIKEFETESLLQADSVRLGYAYFFKAQYLFYIEQKADSALYYLERSKDLVGGQTKSLVRLRFTIYIAEKKYSLVLFHLKKVLDKDITKENATSSLLTYAELGFLYRQLGNADESISALRKSLKISRILEDQPFYNGEDSTLRFNFTEMELLRHQFDNYGLLVSAYNKKKDFTQAFNAIDTAYILIEKMQQIDPSINNKVDRQYIGAKRAATYLEIDNLPKSRWALDELKALIDSSSHYAVWYTYLSHEATYYYKCKNYHRGLEYINRALSIPEMDPYPDDIIEAQILKSRILHRLGNAERAFTLMDSIVLVKDSIANKLINSQVSELQTAYEVDVMEAKIERQSVELQKNTIILIALSGCVLLLLGILIFYKRNKKEKEKKNKKIFDQYRLMKSYLDQIRTQRDELQLAREKVEEESINWAEKAHRYLLETEAFKKEDLSRDDLATALGTNRQYLIDAIKNETGKTFKDYINSIRVEYAYEMLITDWEASIESIYIASGFTTRSTFNRLFKEQYGMNPLEMREAAKQKEEEIEILVEDND